MLCIFDFGFQPVPHSVNHITQVLFRAHNSGRMQRNVVRSAAMQIEGSMRGSYFPAVDRHNSLSPY